MAALAISFLVFACVFGGALGGMFVRTRLPEPHLSEASQSVIKLGTGLVATMAALVLGLLIATASSTYSSDRAHVNQMTAQIVLLDRLLAQYGPEATALRSELRRGIELLARRIWRNQNSETADRGAFVPNSETEAFYLELRTLSPKTDLQRWLQDQALAAASQLAQTRLLLFVQSSSTAIPVPFLVVVVFWLVIIFFSFGLPARANATLFTVLLICAFSASAAIFLILEMSEPFVGLLAIPSAPLRNALLPLSS